jgi:hypothetical protein
VLPRWYGPRDHPPLGGGAGLLASNDPTLLVGREAPLLRRLGTRFFLSSGTTRDRGGAEAARAFGEKLDALDLRHRMWFGSGGHDGAFWRSQLTAALRYALIA